VANPLFILPLPSLGSLRLILFGGPSDFGLETIPSRGYFYTEMIFECDEAKSADNKAKHGLDFTEAQKLWQDVDALEVPARSHQERRKLWIARHGQKLWSAIFTEREGRIRIISVRRARAKEEALYEQAEPDDSTES